MRVATQLITGGRAAKSFPATCTHSFAVEPTSHADAILPLNPDTQLDSLRAERTAALRDSPLIDSAETQAVERTFVSAMRASGATPEKTIAALKSLAAIWPEHRNMPARESERLALVALCIGQYFEEESAEHGRSTRSNSLAPRRSKMGNQ